MRVFIEVDNERAYDVGSSSRGTRTFQARKPKVPEVCPEVTVRESPDELTLRAEEVETSKALINVNHIEPERSGPPLVDADWYAFCQALYRGIEGEDWEEMYESYKEMSGAVGVRKPQEAQKAKTLWKMKSAKDAGEEYYDPAREDIYQRKKQAKISTLGRAPRRSSCCAGQCPEVRGRSVLRLNVGSRLLWNRGCNDLRPCGFTSDRKRSCGLFWMHGAVCVYAELLRSGTSQGDTGRMASSFFSF